MTRKCKGALIKGSIDKRIDCPDKMLFRAPRAEVCEECAAENARQNAAKYAQKNKKLGVKKKAPKKKVSGSAFD